MEQTNTTTPESAPVSAPDSTAAPVSTSTQVNGEGGNSVGHAEDAYTRKLREKFGKKTAESTPASVKDGEAKGVAVNAKPEQKDGQKAPEKAPQTRGEKHDQWWKQKSPGEKANLTAKQDREELRKATERIKAMEAELAALKGAKGSDVPKTHDQFDNDDDWVRYAVDNRLMEIEAEKQKTADAQSKQDEKSRKWAAAMEAAFTDKEELAAAAELFRENVNKLPVDNSVLSYIVESGNPRLLLHLVRNPSAQKLLAPGTSELLVGARLAKIERWLESKQGARLADTTAKPAAQTATRTPELNSATGSANNIGSVDSVPTKTREVDLWSLQRRILGRG